MQTLVFIPGIMGTEMVAAGGERVWPPKPQETVFGYKGAAKLLQPDTRPGEVIRNVSCVDVYGSVIDRMRALGFREGDPNRRLRLFPYDWRLDLQSTADALAATLDEVGQEGATEILIVAHSMGGLVARLVLESGAYADRPWFGRVVLFAALATPHRGAPLALARILGLDSTLGVSAADFRRIGADRRYPSGYQLLPAPGEDACWDQSDPTLRPLDIHDPAQAARLGLDPQLLARARWVHETLAKAPPPPGCRYFYFAGTGHQTATRVNVARAPDGSLPTGRMIVTRTLDAGDGTVPLWSALPGPGQKQTVVNEHASVFTGAPFMAVFNRLLGGQGGPAVEAAAVEAAARGEIALSLDTPVQEQGMDIELVLAPAAPMGRCIAAVMAQPIDETGRPLGEATTLEMISYAGAPIDRLRVLLPGIEEPGHYRLSLAGAGLTAAPVVISVMQAA